MRIRLGLDSNTSDESMDDGNQFEKEPVTMEISATPTPNPNQTPTTPHHSRPNLRATIKRNHLDTDPEETPTKPPTKKSSSSQNSNSNLGSPEPKNLSLDRPVRAPAVRRQTPPTQPTHTTPNPQDTSNPWPNPFLDANQTEPTSTSGRNSSTAEPHPAQTLETKTAPATTVAQAIDLLSQALKTLVKLEETQEIDLPASFYHSLKSACELRSVDKRKLS
ncbi:hypothetical protein FRB90_008761, partial [Tulasnella sp. 427]